MCSHGSRGEERRDKVAPGQRQALQEDVLVVVQSNLTMSADTGQQNTSVSRAGPIGTDRQISQELLCKIQNRGRYCYGKWVHCPLPMLIECRLASTPFFFHSHTGQECYLGYHSVRFINKTSSLWEKELGFSVSSEYCECDCSID